MGCGASTKTKYTDTGEAKEETQAEAAPSENVKETTEADAASSGEATKPEAAPSGDVTEATEGEANQVANQNSRSVRGNRKPAGEKVKRIAPRTEPRRIDWSCADPEKWTYPETEFNGSMTYRTQPITEEETAPVEEGVQKLKDNPTKYLGIYYQTDMTQWPAEQQKFILILRTKSGFGVKEEPGGGFTYIRAHYEALDHDVSHEPDGVTEHLSYQGNALPVAILPGRGKGCADVPMIKFMGDVDPNDISQGGVGDCWLLSAISALAEYDGAIHKLFHKTEDIGAMPKDGPNKYTVTLWDLSSWQPVDIVVDESLCSNAEGSGLLGACATITGELWICYLEKAVAVHCGGWDKIDGGQCTHAWRLLTGCKDQYTFRDTGDGYGCYGAFNPNTQEWEQLANSPHDGFQGLWPMLWPEVGGGGDTDLKISCDEMFDRMCAWDDNNFIMSCGTTAGSDTEDTEGIVDGHAYTILDCVDNAGGTEFDMVKVRNPWGKGEFKSGRWDDDGPGWDEYPQVKEALKPVVADDGVFWVDKQEFFQFFHTIYLCATDMSHFQE